MASAEIFDVFNKTHEKKEALLHGHSYTANPVGCEVAVHTLRVMEGMDRDREGAWGGYKAAWKKEAEAEKKGEEGDGPEVWSSWSPGLLRELSMGEKVESVFALGSVLSVTLRDRTGGGTYT